MRALLLSDKAHLRREVEGFLRSRGYEVNAPASCRIPWKSLRTDPFSLIVLQISDCGARTSKRLSRLRAAVGFENCQILTLLDNTDTSRFDGLLLAGADDYLPPPITPETLTARLLSLESRLGRNGHGANGERHWAEEALRQSQELYHTLVDSARDTIFTLSPKGIITSLNPAFESFTGWPREEWIGRHFSPLIHPADFCRTTKALRAVVRGTTLPILELRVQSKSGQPVTGEFLLTPQTRKGQVMGLLGIARDITRRKRVQEALQASEDRFHDLVEHTRALICIHDLRGRILFLNREVELTTGYGREALLNREFRDLLPKQDGSFFERYITSIRSKGFDRGLMRISTRQGEERILEYQSTLRKEGTSKSVVQSLAIDITEQQRAERSLRESEQRHRSLFEGVPVGIYCSTPQGQFLDVNPALVKILGYEDRESLLAVNAVDLYKNPIDRTRWERRMKGGADVQSFEVELLRRDGQVIWARLAIHGVHGSQGQTLYYQGTVQDITEHRRAVEALQASEERFRALVQNSNDMLVILDRDGTVLYESPAVERILGYAPGTWTGTSKFEYVHPDDLVRVAEAFREISRHPEKTTTLELRLRRRDGSWCFVEATGTNLLEHPAVRGLVVNSRDITERKQAEEQLLHDALHDTLTGLPNRALLLDRLERVTKLSRREPQRQFAVLFLDLDRFKLINDSLGHRVGDLLLIEISKALEQVLRPTDTIARLGGDEFVILLEEVQSCDDALRVAERIHYRLQAPFGVHEHEIFTTASIGIALSRSCDDLPETLLRDADTAMYRAKAQGKACHVVFDDDMHQRALRRLELETELRHALDHQDFCLLYQPITCLKTGRLVGFECLVRWRHPDHGLVLPEKFLSIMEETGLIIPLGRFIFENACRQLQLLQKERPSDPLIVSVNLSNKQFFHPRLLDELREILNETGVDPRCLALEITEGILVDHTEWAARRFSKLKEMQFRLYLDDFGKGYSSLSYLRGFPVDMLKIDRAFVDNIDQREDNEEIMHAIVTLGHNLGLEVVAEGVETAAQAQVSRQLACDYGQGNFFSEPLDPDQATELVSRYEVSV